jgi:lysophospholipase L1-like esterase
MTQQGYSEPDFVFIQLGINDMFGSPMFDGFDTRYNTFKTNLLAMIQSIHTYSSSIKIVMNMITMPGKQEKYNQIYGTEYYNWERRFVDVKTNSKLLDDLPDYVLMNPHNLILDPLTMIADDVHPNADGYAVLGSWDATFMFAN